MYKVYLSIRKLENLGELQKFLLVYVQSQQLIYIGTEISFFYDVVSLRCERHTEFGIRTTTTSDGASSGSFPLINLHLRVSECTIDERQKWSTPAKNLVLAWIARADISINSYESRIERTRLLCRYAGCDLAASTQAFTVKRYECKCAWGV